MDEINHISRLMNSCKNYSNADIEDLPANIKSNFSLMFNNIDGAASNFDSFITQIERYNFSAIGISETNLDEEQGSLYNIPGYNSIFQSKIGGKTKGSGIGLYLQENLIYTHCTELSQCTKNLETLFVKITSLASPILLGVIYRPPSANSVQSSIDELESLIKKLPSSTRLILAVID